MLFAWNIGISDNSNIIRVIAFFRCQQGVSFKKYEPVIGLIDAFAQLILKPT